MAKLPKIATCTGDKGETGLVGGHRVSKDSPHIWACGAVDELNSLIGLAQAFLAPDVTPEGRKLDAVLATIQNHLFVLGAELATMPADVTADTLRITGKQLAVIEQELIRYDAAVEPLTEFILPGGGTVAAVLHLARTVCRRAERYCVRLAHEEEIGKGVVPYLNRLGDLLFVLARWTNRRCGVTEIRWRKEN
jgi:cob(I)alamin adenosyltransferase